VGSFEGGNENTIVKGQEPDEDWLRRFREIIIVYNENRAPDPFMLWFRQRDSKQFFADDFQRVLAILIDARFDQRTTAENALENTIAVVNRGALERLVTKIEIPLLIPKQNVTAEKWTDLFCSSLSELHSLSARIVAQKEWDASELLGAMKGEFRVPYLGTKTARLAVRWLHELVSSVKIEMLTYRIPIDSLVYRVCSRLGIIDPHIEKYSGENSPADVKVQAYVSKVFPQKPWLLDEPLWSTGRQPDKGGHCFPKNPNCNGCLFESICRRRFLDADPSSLGMEVSNAERQPTYKPRQQEVTSEQAEFAKFVEDLKQKGVKGEEYREKIMQWQREHQKGET
jgi:endonuclease III